MNKIHQLSTMYLSFWLSMIILLFSCNVNTFEYYTIDEISPYKDFHKNEELAKDLVSYQYPWLFHEATGIKDKKLQGNVSYDYFVQEDTKKITFRLTVKNEALELSDTLVSFFENYVITKKEEHIEKNEQLNEAIQLSVEVIQMIEDDNYEGINNILSPLLSESIKKEFPDVLKDRNLKMKNSGNRLLLFKQIHPKVESYVGEFYILFYRYDDGMNEEITIHNHKGEMKLLGYRR